MKFTEDGGRITLRARAFNSHVNIAIEDTGIGIPKSALRNLGKPFEQVESQFTKTHRGSGLGLAIAKSLTELHGGAMRIRSSPASAPSCWCACRSAIRRCGRSYCRAGLAARRHVRARAAS